MNFLLGFFLGALIASLAWKAGALNRSGALAAFLTGGLIFGSGGLSWAVLLLTFFISSSLLSRLFARRKANLDEKYAKGSRRDWGQVFANGGLGALLALLHALLPGQAWTWIAFIGAMAAVNADTWATEIGAFSRTSPRLITSGARVEPGTSGGVTLLGYGALLAGAGLIGLAGALTSPAASNLSWILLAAAAGLAGSTADSLLGATLQAIYYCPACKKETEKHPRHSCGADTEHIRGWRWLNNDWVNFACSLVGALGALAIWAVGGF
jgi:uncharacterized protein (TIGR00297 family)